MPGESLTVNNPVIANSPISSNTQVRTQKLIFIDYRVQNNASFLQNLVPQAEVVLLNDNRDGLQQVADYLANKAVDSIQIVSPCSAGDLCLGSSHLHSECLTSSQPTLITISQSISANGDFSLYSYNVNERTSELKFVQNLADADIATVNDRTS